MKIRYPGVFQPERLIRGALSGPRNGVYKFMKPHKCEQEMNEMADKNIKKEKKQKKASASKTENISCYVQPVIQQPEVIKKGKKEK